ncbi:MAG: DUF4199 domain-containing protein [Chitinophagaceae bacterium]
MIKLTPLVKGAITGVVMLGITLVLSSMKIPANSGAQYLIYATYAGGIIWTLMTYAGSGSFTGKFGELFGQGFRCFIVVTLILVIFTFIFSSMHPEFAEQSAQYYREDLVKANNLTPGEIDKQVASYKKSFTTTVVSMTIFQNLILGTIFTAAGAGFILMRRKQ